MRSPRDSSPFRPASKTSTSPRSITPNKKQRSPREQPETILFKAIANFELKYHLKAPLFYILFIVYFLLTFGAVTTDGVQIGGAVGAVNRNAPYVIMLFMLVMSVFGVLTTTAFVANSIHRDFEMGTDALFFSSPIKKWQYLFGRFSGSFVVATLVSTGVAVA